jgi:hypothetical protein
MDIYKGVQKTVMHRASKFEVFLLPSLEYSTIYNK